MFRCRGRWHKQVDTVYRKERPGSTSQPHRRTNYSHAMQKPCLLERLARLVVLPARRGRCVRPSARGLPAGDSSCMEKNERVAVSAAKRRDLFVVLALSTTPAAREADAAWGTGYRLPFSRHAATGHGASRLSPWPKACLRNMKCKAVQLQRVEQCGTMPAGSLSTWSSWRKQGKGKTTNHADRLLPVCNAFATAQPNLQRWSRAPFRVYQPTTMSAMVTWSLQKSALRVRVRAHNC